MYTRDQVRTQHAKETNAHALDEKTGISDKLDKMHNAC
jgi:hypothetical protein